MGTADDPRLPPTHLLNDNLAAILGAAGTVEALRRRQLDGGSYHVHVDLARISMWVQDLGLYDKSGVQHLPHPSLTSSPIPLATSIGPWGTTRYLPTQIRYGTYRPGFTRPAEPLGASEAAWE